MTWFLEVTLKQADIQAICMHSRQHTLLTVMLIKLLKSLMALK